MLDRIAHITEQDDYEIAYSYWADGQKEIVAVKNPSDQEIYNVFYTYDAANRLDVVTEPELGVDGFVADFDYDDNGNRSLAQYYRTGDIFGPTVDIDYNYNRDNLLTDFSTTGGPTFSLNASGNGDIDGLGRLVNADETLTKTDSSTISHTLDYSYDRLSQLTSASVTNIGEATWTGSYDYRKDGNIDSRNINSDPCAYAYNGDLMINAEGETLDWDLNGNMTTGVALQISWNWDNKLRNAQVGSDSIACKYSPDGSIIYKESVKNSVTSKRKYLVDITGEYPFILLEVDGDTGVIVKTYVHALGQLLMQHNGDTSANKYFYLHDRLGSVRALMNSSGSITDQYTYDPFGNHLEDETTGATTNRHRFAGYKWDSVAGMYNCNARWYDPLIYRFTSRDPVRGNFKEPFTLHAYLYCLNDPINNIDPTGESLGSAKAVGIWAYAAHVAIGVGGRAAAMLTAAVARHNITQIAVLMGATYAGNKSADALLDLALDYARGKIKHRDVTIDDYMGVRPGDDPGNPLDFKPKKPGLWWKIAMLLYITYELVDGCDIDNPEFK